ncbi:hypothetical protein Tco_0117392 [Tanacetum coccineum]
MADHSHNWNDKATTRQGSNDSSDDIDMQKLNENIHDIEENLEKAREVNKEPVPRDLPIVNLYVPLVPFPRSWKEQEDDPYITRESIYTIGFSKRINEDEIKLLIAEDTQSSLTKM